MPLDEDDLGRLRGNAANGRLQLQPPGAEVVVALVGQWIEIEEDVVGAALRAPIEAEEDAFQAELLPHRLHAAGFFLAQFWWCEGAVTAGAVADHGRSSRDGRLASKL